MKNLATTAAGICTILGGSATFIGVWLNVGVPPAEVWTALGTALSVGVGLIKAADAKTVNKVCAPELPPQPPQEPPHV